MNATRKDLNLDVICHIVEAWYETTIETKKDKPDEWSTTAKEMDVTDEAIESGLETVRTEIVKMQYILAVESASSLLEAMIDSLDAAVRSDDE